MARSAAESANRRARRRPAVATFVDVTRAKSGEVRNDGVDRYLERIGYTGRRTPTLTMLRKLQVAHLIHVPFENLDVFHRRGVRVDVNWSFQKIVNRRRGGWCYELNGCFGALLEQLGYRVVRLSSRTFEPDTGGLSADFDHLALLVRVGADRFLVDVDWGDCALTPIPAEPGDYKTRPRPVRIETTADSLRLIERVNRVDGETAWELQYEASLHPRALADFDPRSRYLQTEPGLNWTEKPLVTRATSAKGARLSLHADRLRTREDDLSFADEPVSDADWPAVLQERFGIAPP
jgi:N-hydroxyarylamine O-acetyltransferase